MRFSSLDRHECRRLLARRIGAALLAVPLGALFACSSTPGNCGNVPPPKTWRITYQTCAGVSADASASNDGGITCFDTCEQACVAMNTPMAQGGITCTEVSKMNGQSTVDCTATFQCVGGRLTDGLDEPELGGDVLGAFFARSAWLEAASIRSFERLARELADHGAPDDLVRAAKDAAHDETRHARLLSRLAEKYGAKSPRVSFRDSETRSLEAIALENAIEGCVGETYGALVAHWQAEHASDPEVRAAFETIAPDELSHAALAWAIAAWAETRLDADAIARVRSARERMADGLARGEHVDPRITDIAGFPAPHVARSLVGAMFA